MTNEEWCALIVYVLALIFATCIVFVVWHSLGFVLSEVTK